MAKIDISGINKDKLLRKVLADTPYFEIPIEEVHYEALLTIAETIYGFDRWSNEWDDKLLRENGLPDILSSVVKEIRDIESKERQQESKRRIEETQVAADKDLEVTAREFEKISSLPTPPAPTTDAFERQYFDDLKLSQEISDIRFISQGRTYNIYAKNKEGAERLANAMTADAVLKLKRSGALEDELVFVQYPPLILEKLFGFQYTFEKNAISGRTDEAPELSGQLKGPYEVKLPHIRAEDSKKLLYAVIQRLEAGISDDMLSMASTNLPAFEEYLANLPEVPKDAATEALLSSYEPILRIEDSGTKPFQRLLIPNYQLFVERITPKIKSTLEKAELDKQLYNTRYGVAVSEAIFPELIARPKEERTSEISTNPGIRVRSLLSILKQKGSTAPRVVSVPIEFYAPAPALQSNHTDIIIHVGGSMGTGNPSRLEILKGELKKVLEDLANRPGQTISLRTYSDSTKILLNNQSLNKMTLDSILKDIDKLRADELPLGRHIPSSDPMPALQQVLGADRKKGRSPCLAV